MTRARELLVLIAAAMAAATSTPLGKTGAEIAAPALAAARTGIAAIVILAIVPRATARAIAALSTKQRATLFVAGALLAAHFTLFLAGVARTSLPAAAALIAVEPLAVVLVGWIAFGARPSAFEAAGIVLATIGGAIVARGPEIGEHSVTGDLLVVAAVVLYALYVAAARALRDAMPPWSYAGSVYAIAAAVALPFALAWQRDVPSARACASAIGLALVPTLIGHTLIQRLARASTPAVVGLVSPGEAVGSTLIGVVLLGAAPSAHEIVGGVLVIAATVIGIGARRS